MTATLGIATAVGYLRVLIFYSKRDETVGLPGDVYIHFALLLWTAAATTLLSLALRRRTDRVEALLDVRQRLVAEAAAADEVSGNQIDRAKAPGVLDFYVVRCEFVRLAGMTCPQIR